MLHTVSAADRSFDGNDLGSIIEEFASVHGLPARLVEFRKSALGLAGELISGIGPIFVLCRDRWQSKHPIPPFMAQKTHG